MNRRMLLILLSALLLVACAPQPAPTPTPSIPPPSPTPDLPTATPARLPSTQRVDPESAASVRFFHAAPDLPAIDLYLESALAASRLGVGKVSAPIALNAGEYLVRAVPSGESFNSERVLFNEVINLAPRETVIFTLRGVDTLSAGRFLEDTSPLLADQTRLVAVNALKGDARGEFTLNDQPLGAADAGGQGTNPAIVLGGKLKLRYNQDGQTLLEQNLTLKTRQSHTIFLYTTPEGKPALTVVSSGVALEGQVRVLNLAQGFESVSLSLDDQPFMDGLSYNTRSDYQILPARLYTLRASAKRLPTDEAEPLTPTSELRLSVDPDARLTLLVTEMPLPAGDSGKRYGIQVTVLKEDLSRTEDGKARLMVMNTIPDTEDLKVYDVSDPLPGFPPLDYRAYSGGVELSAGTRDLSFTARRENSERTVESALGVTLRPGVLYLYVVTGQRVGTPLIYETEVGLKSAGPTPTPLSPMTVRFVNLLTDVGSVDVLIGDKKVFSDIAPETSSEYARIETNIVTVRVVRKGTDEAVAAGDLNIAPSAELTLFAVGRTQDSVLLQSFERVNPTTTGGALRVINAVSAGEAVTIHSPVEVKTTSNLDPSLPTPTPVARTIQQFERIDPLSLSRVRLMRPGTYSFSAYKVTDFTELTRIEKVALEGSKRYELVILPGNESTGGVLRMILIASDPRRGAQ